MNNTQATISEEKRKELAQYFTNKIIKKMNKYNSRIEKSLKEMQKMGSKGIVYIVNNNNATITT